MRERVSHDVTATGLHGLEVEIQVRGCPRSRMKFDPDEFHGNFFMPICGEIPSERKNISAHFFAPRERTYFVLMVFKKITAFFAFGQGQGRLISHIFWTLKYFF